MGDLVQLWPARKSKYSLALECQSCKHRQVVEPSEVYQHEVHGRAIPGVVNVVYGLDADSCERCGGTKMKIMNPKEWNRA
jgi:hypothetical protein